VPVLADPIVAMAIALAALSDNVSNRAPRLSAGRISKHYLSFLFIISIRITGKIFQALEAMAYRICSTKGASGNASFKRTT
jgi:hypothetical protein